MPTPQPPLLLYDNVFNRIRQYPGAVLAASSSAAGTDVRYLTRFARGKQYWQAAAAAANNYVQSDLGAGTTRAVDALFIDRGHNLWGKTVQVYADDGAGGSILTTNLTVPATATLDRWGRYTNAGDPTTAVMCVTEEGALYSLFAAFAARRRFRIAVVESWQPILFGVILGGRTQLPNFSAKLDEDAGTITGERSEVSDAGRVATSTPYQHRELELVYKRLGVTTYDTQARDLREAVWARRAPTFIAPNYGRSSARAWLYRCSTPRWTAATEGVARPLTLQFTEWQAAL
jgi:hypothetical protein